MKCPICEKGELRSGTAPESLFGVALGTFPAEICDACGETFTDAIATAQIESAAREKGIWGLGKKTKVTKTGNSLSVRIPKEIADYLKLKAGREAYIHPDGNKLVIEAE